MEELVSLANKLGSLAGAASFATVLLVILWGSWKRVWIWGRENTKLEARLVLEKQALADDRDWWRSIAMRATGLAEQQGHILRVKEQREVAKVDDVNRQLLGNDS